MTKLVLNPTTSELDMVLSKIAELGDVDNSAPSKNDHFIWNGTQWVAAPDGTTFIFSIATFTDNHATTGLIGSGIFKGPGSITFDMTYNNGPATDAFIAIGGTGGVSWTGGSVVVTDPFTTQDSVDATAYPTNKDTTINYTLNATNGENDTDIETLTFRNNIKWGIVSGPGPYTSGIINALTGTALSNDQTRSVSVNAGAGSYILFAYPNSYTNLHDDGVLFKSITCPIEVPSTTSVTNGSGFVENYEIYRSTEHSLGNSTFITSTSSTLIDPLYYGITTKTNTYLESDVEGLATNTITNDNTQVWNSITTGVGEYMLFAFPFRLGIPVFYVGGFAGGFESPETVSVTNVNGYAEDYYVWRSTNSNLGATVVETKAT